LAVISYLLLPITIQGCLLIDIDNTFMPLGLLFFSWLYITVPKSFWRTIILFFSITLLFWIKPTTTYALGLIIPLYEYFSTKKILNSLSGLLTFILAFLFFKLSYWLYSIMVGINFYQITFAHNSFDPVSFFSIGSILKAVYYLNTFILWTSPYVFVLALSKCWSKSDKKNFIGIVFIVILVAYLLIKGTTGSFPKYLVPLYSLMSRTYFIACSWPMY